MNDQRGSVTVVAAGMMAVLAALVLLSADVWHALAARSRAQTAADAAALAAAQEMTLPQGATPDEVAAGYAQANGASILSCRCAAGSLEAVVEVTVPVGPLFLLPDDRLAHATARATTGDPI